MTQPRRSFVTSVSRSPDLPGYTAQLREIDRLQDALAAHSFQLGDAVLDTLSDLLVDIAREADSDRAELEQGRAP